VVKRKVEGESGTLQIWVEGAMTEEERLKKRQRPPNPWRWMMEIQLMKLFDALVYNDDRNTGNILIDSDWKLILIDHTRAFRKLTDLPEVESLKFCDKGVWERFKNLDASLVREKLGGLLRDSEIESLLKRHQALIAHYRRLIEERGSDTVLFRVY
jgi:hypothetical protein